MVAIVDYGVGNLFSLGCSLSAIGQEHTVTADASVLREAERIILPGVGAFGDAAEKLRATGLDAVVIDEAAKGKPLLASAWGCSCSLKRATNTANTRGWGCCAAACAPSRTSFPRG